MSARTREDAFLGAVYGQFLGLELLRVFQRRRVPREPLREHPLLAQLWINFDAVRAKIQNPERGDLGGPLYESEISYDYEISPLLRMPCLALTAGPNSWLLDIQLTHQNLIMNKIVAVYGFCLGHLVSNPETVAALPQLLGDLVKGLHMGDMKGRNSGEVAALTFIDLLQFLAQTTRSYSYLVPRIISEMAPYRGDLKDRDLEAYVALAGCIMGARDGYGGLRGQEALRPLIEDLEAQNPGLGAMGRDLGLNRELPTQEIDVQAWIVAVDEIMKNDDVFAILSEIEEKSRYGVELRPNQEAWAARVDADLLPNFAMYMDTSFMGRGKTYITIYNARKNGYRLLVVCPVNAEAMWKERWLLAGGQPQEIHIISYDTLSGTLDQKKRQIRFNHFGKGYSDYYSLLEADVVEDIFVSPKSHTGRVFMADYRPSPYFIEEYVLGKRGYKYLIVFDEAQYLKNISDRSRAAAALTGAIQEHVAQGQTQSRFAFLTATPFDKLQHVLPYARAMGIVRDEVLYMLDEDENVLSSWEGYPTEGFRQMFEYCMRKDPQKTQYVLRQALVTGKSSIEKGSILKRTDVPEVIDYEYLKTCMKFVPLLLKDNPMLDSNKEPVPAPLRPSHFKTEFPIKYAFYEDDIYLLAFELMIQVILPPLRGYIPPPSEEVLKFRDIANGFYYVGANTAAVVKQILKQFDKVKIDALVGGMERRKNNKAKKSKLSQLVEKLELAKINTWVRLTESTIRENPRAKVVICVNYLLALNAIAGRLRELGFDPHVIHGGVNIRKRVEIEKEFQTNPGVNVIVMSTKTGSVAISLHDTVGDSPRFMFISPTYNIIPDTQASGRIDRDGIQSKATIRYVYLQDARPNREPLVGMEVGIWDALATKGKILGLTLAPGQLEEFKKPSEYVTSKEEITPELMARVEEDDQKYNTKYYESLYSKEAILKREKLEREREEASTDESTDDEWELKSDEESTQSSSSESDDDSYFGSSASSSSGGASSSSSSSLYSEPSLYSDIYRELGLQS